MNQNDSMQAYDEVLAEIKKLENERHKHNVAAQKIRQFINWMSPEMASLVRQVGPWEAREISLRTAKTLARDIDQKYAVLREIEKHWS